MPFNSCAVKSTPSERKVRCISSGDIKVSPSWSNTSKTVWISLSCNGSFISFPIIFTKSIKSISPVSKIELNHHVKSLPNTELSSTEKDYLHAITRNPPNIYQLKVNNRKSRNRCKICSKLTIKTPDRCRQCRSDVFEYISHFFYCCWLWVCIYLLRKHAN